MLRAAFSLSVGSIVAPLTTALMLLVASDSKSMTAVSFTPPSSSSRASLSVLSSISIASDGPLVSDSASPDIVIHGGIGYRVDVRQDNVTLSLEIDRPFGGCLLDMYDGQRLWLGQDEMRWLKSSLPSSTHQVQEPTYAGNLQQPIVDSTALGQLCPERLLEHNLGVFILDSGFAWNLSKGVGGKWVLKKKVDLAGADYVTGVSALTYGQFLYLLNSKSRVLTRHFLSDPAVLAQEITAGAPNSYNYSSLILSSGTSDFPSPHIYAALGNTLFIIALPGDPFDGAHAVTSITTSLEVIKTTMLAGPEGRYLVLSGSGGIRVYERVSGGASVVEIATLLMETADWLMLF